MPRCFQLIKVEHHIKFPAFFSCKHLCHIHADTRCFAHGKCTVRLKGTFSYLMKVFMEIWSIVILLHSGKLHHLTNHFITVWQALRFGYVIDNIHAEAVHALI